MHLRRCRHRQSADTARAARQATTAALLGHLHGSGRLQRSPLHYGSALTRAFECEVLARPPVGSTLAFLSWSPVASMPSGFHRQTPIRGALAWLLGGVRLSDPQASAKRDGIAAQVMLA